MNTHDRHDRLTAEAIKDGWDEIVSRDGVEYRVSWHHGHGKYQVWQRTPTTEREYYYSRLDQARDTVEDLMNGKTPYYEGETV